MAKKKPEGWFSDKPPSQKKGEGAYSDSSDLRFTRPPVPGFETRSRAKTIDANSEANGGFAAPLNAPKE